MRTLCTLAIMIAGAGLIAGVPSRYAQACDDDRYPCPVREQAVQETANAPAKPAPQQKKKVNHTRANEEASAKPEATAPADVSKPAMQEHAMQKVVEAGLAAVTAAPADDERKSGEDCGNGLAGLSKQRGCWRGDGRKRRGSCIKSGAIDRSKAEQ